MSENHIYSEAEEEHDTFASHIDVTSTNPSSSRAPARNSSNATLRQSQSNAETSSSSKPKKRTSKSNVRSSTSTSKKVGARSSKLNNASNNPRSTVSNTRQTVSGRGTVAGRTTHSMKEEEKIKMSAAARKALMDTESRKRDDENYNPVTDILFGGWGKKAEKEKKENDKEGEEKSSRDSKNKHGKKGGVPEPILEAVAEEEKDGEKVTFELSTPATAVVPTVLGATGTADPISQQKQASLRRRGSVCLVEKQVVNEENDNIGGLDKPKFNGQRRLSTSTPGLMLRRPTLEADSTSKTKLADLNSKIENIRASTSSTTNLMKEQKGRETIITERISKLNLQNNSSGISFGLQRESTAILPDILPLKKDDEKDDQKSKTIEEEEVTTTKSRKSQSNEAAANPPVRFSLNRPPMRRPSISQNIKINDSTPAIVKNASDRRSISAKTEASKTGVKFAPEVIKPENNNNRPTTPEPIKVLPGPVFVADSSSNSSFEEPEPRYTRNRRQSVVIPDGINKQNLAKTMERARRQSVVNNQISSTRLSTMKNRRQSLAVGLQTPSSMKLNTTNNTPSSMNLSQRRSSFAVAPTAHLDGMHDHTFKGAADRIRRLSCALSPFGGLGAVQADRRQSIRRGSISNNTSPRFSLTPDSLNPVAVSHERRKSMRAGTTPGLGLPGQGGASRRKSFINFAKSKENLESLHHDQMTPASEALTTEQIQAFKEAFDLFDNNGGGTIDSAELKETLDSVGIEIDQEDIEDVMMKLDEDGNGEIDFEEFLNLMTNTEMFLEAFARKKNHDGNDANEHGYRDHLLFDALTEFMKKSALKAADEIVGYYAKKYKKVVKTYNMNKGAHVVGHYADGARLIGLTEKQIYRELKRLRMYSNLTKDEKNSPYAQPLHLALLKTDRRTNRSIRPPKRVNSARSCNSSNASNTSRDGRDRKKMKNKTQERKRKARRMSMVGQQSKGTPKMKQPGLSTMPENSTAQSNQQQQQANKPKQQTYKPDSMDQIPKSTTTTQEKTNINNNENQTNQDKSNSNNAIPSTTQSSLETNNNSNNNNKNVKDILANLMKEKREKEAAANPDGTAPTHHTGKIRITVRNHIKDSKMAGTTNTKNDIRMQSIIEKHRQSQLVEKRPSEILPNIHQPGWLLQRTCVVNTDMPINKKWSRVPVGLLPKLRKVVKKKVKKFVKKKEDSKLQNNMQHFRELDTRAAAYTQPLMNQFLAVSSAYSCATPDNRIRLQVESLEKIQHKDEKLREIDDQMAKRGGGDGGGRMDSRMKSMKNNSREMHNNNNNSNGINKTNNNNTQNNNNNQASIRQRPEFNQSALDTIRRSLGRKSLGKKEAEAK